MYIETKVIKHHISLVMDKDRGATGVARAPKPGETPIMAARRT